VPCLRHDGATIWDTLAIAEYLPRVEPESRLCFRATRARAHCRSISGEMHSGFSNLRSALPMNLKAHYPGFKVVAGARADIDRIVSIWRDAFATTRVLTCSAASSMADAMYAPVCSRFLTYDDGARHSMSATLPRDDGAAADASSGSMRRSRARRARKLDAEF
jgi:glutathione S-transferase